MSKELEGKPALVTGASRGIGRASALELAAGGARVAVLSRGAEALAEVVEEIEAQGGEALAIACDVTDPGSASEAVDQVTERWEGLDILVNNAGMTRDMLIMRMDDADWEQVLDVNLSAAFRFIRAVARPMMRQRFGRIINVSSIAGLTGNAGQANYAASKAGLIGLSKSVAKELASRNVTCNVVAPGFVDTEMTASLKDSLKEQIVETVPLGRFGKPEDISGLVRFLAGPGASYITGAVFPVSGGLAI